MGRPIGLAEMAILRKVEVSHGSISVGLCLTEPTCLYAFQIAESVQERLRSVFGEDVELRVEFLPEADGMWWTEDYVSPAARVRLAEARRLDRRALSRNRLNHGASVDPVDPVDPGDPST